MNTVTSTSINYTKKIREMPFLQSRDMADMQPINSANHAELSRLLEAFSPISLKDMGAHGLLNRIEKKYQMTPQQAFSTLAALTTDYDILFVQGQNQNNYRTLYFDTPQFDLFNLHVNGQAERYKVRCREYTDTRQSFLELKHKTRKNRTIKQRISTSQPLMHLTDQAENWLRPLIPFDLGELEPKLLNSYTRITLVNKTICERVTLDFNLQFYRGSKTINLGKVVIAEVKMDKFQSKSPFADQMRKLRIRHDGFSKYCVGVSMLYENVKKNSLKPKLIQLEKLTLGVI